MAVNTLKSQKLLEVLIFTSQMFFIDKKEKQGQSDNAGGRLPCFFCLKQVLYMLSLIFV